jgi:hypothetical protein
VRPRASLGAEEADLRVAVVLEDPLSGELERRIGLVTPPLREQR